MNAFMIGFRRCLFAVLCMALSAVLMHSTGYAKECDEGNCKGIKIYNCTKYEYKMQFKLCCDYEIKVTDCDYYVPADACDGAAKFDFSPCTVLSVGICDLPDNVCFYWDEDGCYVKIYYCD